MKASSSGVASAQQFVADVRGRVGQVVVGQDVVVERVMIALLTGGHLLLQGMDYLQFIEIYHERIKAFHVKDSELRCDGRNGVYGGYQGWEDRAGRFRSLGDGQTDFKAIFTALAKHNFDGWAVLEWECAYKDNLVGAAEGAKFIEDHIIEVSKTSFDDFAASSADRDSNRRTLGLD
mgnify:CR=1 FL=1